MTLPSNVTARVRTQLLIELTNPNDRAATSIDTAQLDLASTDVEADFRTFAGTTYDDTDARHVSEAIVGVILKLQAYMGTTPKPFEDVTEWQERLHDRLRMVTGNNRIRPKSTSELTPVPEAPGGVKVTPWFDPDSAFTDLIPDQNVTPGDPSFRGC